MRIKFTAYIFPAALVLILALFGGCYTQLSTTKDENSGEGEEYSTKERDNNDDEGYRDRDDYNDDYNYHSRFGFSYYYPSYGSGGFPSSIYSSAYNDPWWSSSFGYYGGGYSPYGNSYYNPYSYGYYSPYSSYYYSSLYYRYGYTYGTPVRHRVRDFGSTRGRTSDGTTVNGSGGSGATIDYGRGTSNGGGGTLAPAYNNSGGGGVRGTSSSDVGARPRQGSQRVGTSQGSSVQKGARSNRGAGSRGGGNRGTRRDTQHGYVPNEGGKQSAPPSSQTPTRETGRQPEQSRGREASAPRSAPPPSSGQSSESRSSGSSRGRRP